VTKEEAIVNEGRNKTKEKKTQNRFKAKYLTEKLAEGQGFEPWVPFWGTRTFQARQLNHSCNLP